MNLAKRTLSIMLATLMIVVSCCVFVNADMPEGAIKLDVAGYVHGEKNCIWYADAETTVGQFTEKYAGSAKDMNYFAIAICDENGVITHFNDTLTRDVEGGVKTETVIPEGSFIVGFHGNIKDTFNAFTAAAAVGKKVEVYGVEVEYTGVLEEAKELTDAYIIITEASPASESVKVQPSAHVNLPANAIPLTVGGYIHETKNFVCYTAEETTVGQLTAKFVGAAKDMNAFAIAICNENGIVTHFNNAIGRNTEGGVKTETVIPAGSFIVGINNANTADIQAFNASCAVGKQITVFNVIVKNTALLESGVILDGAGITVADPVDYSGGEYKFDAVGNAYKVDDNMYYQNYTLTSGENGITVDAVALEFNPEDGYIPMAFSGYAGTSGVLDKQYDIATNKYGYDVPAVINGAFFSMDSGNTGSYGTLVGMIIENGRICISHNGYSDSVVAFTTDGTMHIVKSAIDYKLFFNGTEIPNGLYYINKTGGSKNPTWANNFYYYDTSCGDTALTFECCPGYEIICEKIDNTDLMVGATLKGKVLEIRENSYGAALADDKYDLSDKFVLFAKAGTTHAAKINELKAGDEISISAQETIEESKEIMESANSVISNVGWLVKDGVDQTQIETAIGTHSVTLMARWTAFGVKADGSYVYFTTDFIGDSYTTGVAKSATLRDVAKAMIELGCVNVIRMDGGGSTAMYVQDLNETGKPGYTMVCKGYNRPVGDCILVVKASSVRNEEYEASLKEVIIEAKKAYAASPSESLKAIIDEANALLKSEAPVSGDVLKMIAKLSGALSGKSELSDLIAKVSAISYADYSEDVLENLRAAYATAVEVLGNKEATVKDVETAYNELAKWYNLSGENTIILTEGASYTTTAPNRGDGWDDDGIRLTDGSKSNADGGSYKYAGWGSLDKSKPNVVEVVVDLGEVKKVNNYSIYLAGGNWGISAESVKSLTAYVSEDGTTFTQTAYTEELIPLTSNEGEDIWNQYKFSATTEETQTGRYIKFEITAFGGNAFVWIDEVEAALSVTPVTEAIYVTAFNSMVTSGSCMIFTPSIGEVTGGSCNLNYSKNLLLEWNEEKEAYVVIQKWSGSGTTVIGNTGKTTLEEGQLIIAAHDWETGVTSNPVVGSADNARRVMNAKVGDLLYVYGIDMEKETLGVGAYITLGPEVVPTPEYVIGDVSGDGKITALDYQLLKRAVLKTYNLDETQTLAGDINGDGKITALDYQLLKRAVLGTYIIK